MSCLLHNNLIARVYVILHHVTQRIAGICRLSAMQLELCPSILVVVDTGTYWAPGMDAIVV